MAELRDEALERHLRARERQYELDAITMEYALAWDEGRSPRVDEFARRYPRFAREIAEFALYYATIGQNDGEVPPAEPDLTPAAASALSQIAARFAPPAKTPPTTAPAPLDGLTRQGQRLGVPAPQLARRVGLSPDVLAKLESHAIKARTVPEALVQRLAQTLNVTPKAVSAYLSGSLAGPEPAPPRAGRPRGPRQESFLEAVHASALTPREKAEWIRIAAGEAPDTP
ncbi:MAG TPA: hypothetical protein VGR57_02065 [Ktedonobacterales bacterium]|nr:hypothetical protein [Ktedonobacterales bacterium]